MNQYHEFVLTRGDFDERIFLNPDADAEIGTPVKGGANFSLAMKSDGILRKNRNSFQPMTPLTNRRYLPSAQQQASPVTQHTQFGSNIAQDFYFGLIALEKGSDNT